MRHRFLWIYLSQPTLWLFCRSWTRRYLCGDGQAKSSWLKQFWLSYKIYCHFLYSFKVKIETFPFILYLTSNHIALMKNTFKLLFFEVSHPNAVYQCTWMNNRAAGTNTCPDSNVSSTEYRHNRQRVQLLIEPLWSSMFFCQGRRAFLFFFNLLNVLYQH